MKKSEIVKEIIESRSSIFPKDYSGEDIPQEVLEEILNSSNFAPNHKRTKPWRFRVFKGEEKLNLGYRFASQAWGKGYATEFTKKAIDVGLNQDNKEEIFAIVRPSNIASVKVLEKAGMVQIGTLNDVPGQPESLVYRIQK